MQMCVGFKEGEVQTTTQSTSAEAFCQGQFPKGMLLGIANAPGELKNESWVYGFDSYASNSSLSG